MSNKIKLLIVIIIFLIASQWLAVRMVYKHKLNGTPAVVLAGLYNLKAGTIDEIDQSFVISLSEYLKHREFVLEYIIKAGDPAMSESDADSMVWNRLIKNTWLNKLAEENDLSINDEEFDAYLQEVPDLDSFKQEVETEMGVSFDDYSELMIKPLMLETKVYDHLIFNFGDIEGVNKIQAAYGELEGGSDFLSVAQEYSDDMTYVDNTLWVSEDELSIMYDPVRDLKEGEFSKIVHIPGSYGTAPGGYMIWFVESSLEEEGKDSKELRGIFVAAKGVDEFLIDYLEQVNINKLY
ncbi:hypothetical protein HOB10_00545 [Candidatus Parcubacteria bacterium]|jgi:hypothetical protein|nr:hypothetical protein [Candidatus Parcubacteria bacterium]